MKPVKNISHPFFEVGANYIYGTHDLTIVELFPCGQAHNCSGVITKICDGYSFKDQEGQRWCGIAADFKKRHQL